jgi:hypothetical protein
MTALAHLIAPRNGVNRSRAPTRLLGLSGLVFGRNLVCDGRQLHTSGSLEGGGMRLAMHLWLGGDVLA